MTTRNQPEAAFRRTLMASAKLMRWKVAHFGASVRVINKEKRFVGDPNAAGFPDLIMCKAERLIFAELKAEGGRVRANQIEWLNELAKTGAECYVWTPSEWDEIIQILS